tara:strand:- start:1576 stop:2904 length:1329 start_codon:yes stop_codon:yes gene_type:complete
MPNFQFYLQMYSARDEQRYQEAMANAYRDLMIEYKEQATVRNILLEQMSVDKQLKAKVMASIAKAKSEGDISKANDIWNANVKVAQFKDKVTQDNIEQRNTLREEVDRLYELPGTDVSFIGQNVATLGEFGAANIDLENPVDRRRVIEKLSTDENAQKILIQIADYTPEQRDVFMANFGLNIAQRTRLPISIIKQVFAPASPRVLTREQIDKAKLDIIEDRFKPKGIPKEINAALDLIGFEKDRYYNSLLPTTATSTTATTTGQTDVSPGEDLAAQYMLPTPTIEDVRQRASQYYAPFASQEFQREVGFRPPTKEQEQKEQEQKIKEKAKKDAQEAALAELPEYAGKIFKAAPQIEGIVDLEDEEVINNGGVATKWTMTLLEAGKDDLTSAIQKIDAQKDWSPEEVQEAYSILGRDLMRKYRKKRETEPPSLEELMASPERK